MTEQAKPKKLTPEQRSTLAQAAKVYALASGQPDAAALEFVLSSPIVLDTIATALESVAGGTSPLASELRALSKEAA